MKILHVNKFLYRRGGAEGYMEDVAALQAEAGHRVAFFAMDHPENRGSEFARHFPAYLELDPPPSTVAGKTRAVAHMVFSSAARKGMREVAEAFRPDVVHLHNIYHHLSPSILGPLASRGIPTVMTLHDYKLACPTYRLLDHGHPCEACLGGRFHRALLRRCKDGSLSASAAMAGELFLHTITGAYKLVNLFICPSRFLAEKMRAAGVFPERLLHVPHFVQTEAIGVKERAGGAFVFAGRLAAEKGVDTLIEALGRLDEAARLEVAGDGPERARLEALAEKVAPGRVRFHGRLSKDRLPYLLRSALAVAVPSRWYENQPLAVLEAFACGAPVVASELGGLPELIDTGRDGLLAPPNDPEALASALRELIRDPERSLDMGRAGRRKAETIFSPARHLAALEEIYEKARERVGRAA